MGINEEEKLLKEGKDVAIKKGQSLKHEIFGVMLDGGRCLLNESEFKSPQWREVKVGAFVSYHKGFNKNKEIIPIRDKTSYVGRVREKSELFGERLWLGALSKGYNNSKYKVFIGDGAPYNWDIQTNYFPDSIGILDWYHAVEHLYDCAKLIFKEKDPQLIIWAEQRKDELYVGDFAKIRDAIKLKLLNIKNIEVVKKLETEIGYFVKNKDRINYKDYQEKGLPIGSGVIEGGIKQVVNKRLKGTEKHWIIDNGNNILKLRIEEVSDSMHELCQLSKKAA